jgi:hypothetical protein
MGQSRADLNTGPAEFAQAGIAFNASSSESKCIFRANVYALATANALFLKAQEPCTKFNTFRVMAPVARERTPLEENRCPDVWAIMQGVSLYGKDGCLCGVHWFS